MFATTSVPKHAAQSYCLQSFFHPDSALIFMPRNKEWESPLDVPPKDLVENDLTCHSVLGRTLREALHEIASEQSNAARTLSDEMEGNDDSDTNASLPENPTAPILKPESIRSILASLGEAISQSQRERASAESPSAALVRGRIHHFNRRGSKWRVVVEDVQVRRRHPLHRDRRKRNGPSLWRVSEAKTPTASLELPKLEILAYNDQEYKMDA